MVGVREGAITTCPVSSYEGGKGKGGKESSRGIVCVQKSDSRGDEARSAPVFLNARAAYLLPDGRI